MSKTSWQCKRNLLLTQPSWIKVHGIASFTAVTVIWKLALTVPPTWQLESVSIKLFTAGGTVNMAAVDGS